MKHFGLLILSIALICSCDELGQLTDFDSTSKEKSDSTQTLSGQKWVKSILFTATEDDGSVLSYQVAYDYDSEGRIISVSMKQDDNDLGTLTARYESDKVIYGGAVNITQSFLNGLPLTDLRQNALEYTNGYVSKEENVWGKIVWQDGDLITLGHHFDDNYSDQDSYVYDYTDYPDYARLSSMFNHLEYSWNYPVRYLFNLASNGMWPQASAHLPKSEQAVSGEILSTYTYDYTIGEDGYVISAVQTQRFTDSASTSVTVVKLDFTYTAPVSAE